ncbi:MAG: sulfurtransferase TusA family protein [Chloroflexota bacterium]
MIETAATTAGTAITRTIDARGSYCPGPLMELIRAIREGQVGDVLAVRSTDGGSRVDIPKWIEKAGHRLVALETRDGFDEIVVEKVR